MKRVLRLAAIALLFTGGCYSVEPLASVTPTPGTRLQLAINDGGRVALGGSMGPEIGSVEGRLLARQDSTYVLSVVGVNYLNGTFNKWQGETVRINSGMVSGFFEKRFSTGRTIAFLAGAGAVAYLMANRFYPKPSLPEEPPPPPPVSEGRFTLPIRIRLTR